MAVSIIAILGTLFYGLWEGIKYVSDKAIWLAGIFFDFMKKGFDWFLKTSPRWLQVLLFFFIIIILADGIVGFFVELNYACLSDETLRTPSGFSGGVRMYMEKVMTDIENSSTDYDSFITGHTISAQQFDKDDPRGIFYVKCFGTSPKFTLNGLDFLNWQYWTILLVLGMLFKVGKDFSIF